jgi:hypothetical protein
MKARRPTRQRPEASAWRLELDLRMERIGIPADDRRQFACTFENMVSKFLAV